MMHSGRVLNGRRGPWWRATILTTAIRVNRRFVARSMSRGVLWSRAVMGVGVGGQGMCGMRQYVAVRVNSVSAIGALYPFEVWR